jgi:hypothetical protein
MLASPRQPARVLPPINIPAAGASSHHQKNLPPIEINSIHPTATLIRVIKPSKILHLVVYVASGKPSSSLWPNDYHHGLSQPSTMKQH